MLTGGISCKGSYHNINQDYVSFYTDTDVSVIAVSDGLGSRKFSQYGSEALCKSVIDIVNNTDITDVSLNGICGMVHRKWLDMLKDKNVDDCCATALFCFLYQDEVFLFQLGDGLAGVLTKNGTEVLFDDKSTHYINETDCLDSHFDVSLWKYRCFPADCFCGAVLCTDGVEISPYTEEGLKNFTREFITGYSGMSREEITEHIRSWLPEWTGTDDKTIAFMINGE
ncbi:MAG: protein phosphatase 2C domain-containing protein [Ruminococcus sp.]|nr:protein phosphatase 2C domain-containing protein [Ruminococcus sp.]MDE6796833.1 protein phosphatase 2C domain-containing protein [Ruminococcus sp.]